MAPCVSKTASCKLCVNVHFKSIIIKLQVVEFNLIKQLHKSTFKTFYYYLYRYNLIVCLFLLTLSALFCIINIDSVLHDLCKNYFMLRKFFFLICYTLWPCCLAYDHVSSLHVNGAEQSCNEDSSKIFGITVIHL